MSSPVRTFKCTTIFISRGADTWVYDSPEAIPSGLRKELLQSTRGMNSATILIADRGGREEIRKLLEGEASALDEGLRILVRPGTGVTPRDAASAVAKVAAEPALIAPGRARRESILENVIPVLLAVVFALLLLAR
jgi:hypothetical protein